MSELPFLTGEQGKGPLLVLLFFVSAMVVAGWGTWEGALPWPGEVEIAETGREAAIGGRPWILTLDGDRVLGVPPVTPWAIALSIKTFGSNVFAARLPFVLFSVMTLYIVFLVGALGDRGISAGLGWITRARAIGLLSAIVLAASPLFGKYAPHVTSDVPLSFFSILAVLGWLIMPGRRSGAAMWGVGLVGSILTGGSGGFFLVPAALVCMIVSGRGRRVWGDPLFLGSTALALAAGGSWLAWAAVTGSEGFSGSDLWTAALGIFSSPADVARAFLQGMWEAWKGSLPWSIPATAAVLRIVFLRGEPRKGSALSEIDGTLIVFTIAILLAAAAGGRGGAVSFVPALAPAAVLSAREIARWSGALTGYEAPRKEAAGERRAAEGSGRGDTGIGIDDKRDRGIAGDGVKRLWSFNQAMIAIFCLLMLLLVMTPLRFHKVYNDPVKDIAEVAGRLAGKGERLGNYRLDYGEYAARILFYGDISLDRTCYEPGDVGREIAGDKERIYISTAADMNALNGQGVFPSELDVLYRSGELVLFVASD